MLCTSTKWDAPASRCGVASFRSLFSGLSLLTTFSGLSLLAAIFSLLLGCSIVLAQDDFDDDDEGPLFLPGLRAEYLGSDGQTHQRLDEMLSMSWGKESPDLRVPTGKFSALWSGRLQVWKTGKYQFRVFTAGKVCLKIDGVTVLEGQCDKADWLQSDVVELEWGERPIELAYEKTGQEARVSFFWKGPEFEWEPVASHSLMHAPERSPDQRFQRGRDLARALRCAACHQTADQMESIHAPALDRLSGAISPDWMVAWLTTKPDDSPQQADEELVRRMPHFSLSQEDAKAIVAALLAEKIDRPQVDMAMVEIALEKMREEKKKEKKQKEEDKRESEGRKLFLSIGCVACHRVGELGESGLFGGGDLTAIAEKRPDNFFAQWLKDPAGLNADHRMPVFTLTDEERLHLAVYLSTLHGDEHSGHGDEHSGQSNTLPTDAAVVARGKALIQQHRCGQCHRLPGDWKLPDSQPVAMKLDAVPWETSCAAKHGRPGQGQPSYGLTSEQQEAIQIYWTHLPQDRTLAKRALDGKFLMREQNCLACHSRGSAQGLEQQVQAIAKAEPLLAKLTAGIKPPALNSVGDKLLDHVLLDAITSKRPKRRDWLSVRMPKFRLEGGKAEAIARHFIEEDRMPEPPDHEEIAVEQYDLRAGGSRLVTTDGFGCISCHQIGSVKPVDAFPGTHGPDLAQIDKEVRYSWFVRWVQNPGRITPRIEMPAVTMPVRGVLEGRIDHQYAAVWAVLNQEGFRPPKPNPVRVIRQPNVLGKPTEPIVVIDNVEMEGHNFVKPLLVALSNRHSLLFDLESYRLAGWWIGDAARQRLRKKYWYWEGGGDPVMPTSKGDSEVALVYAGRRILPHLDLAFPPEADERLAKGQNWSFTSRIQFIEEKVIEEKEDGADGDAKPTLAEPVELHVMQTWSPFGGENETGTAPSGFRRVVQYTGVPRGMAVELDVAPAAVAMEKVENNRVARSTGKYSFEVKLIDPHAKFQAEEATARVRLLPDAAGVARIEIEYRTKMPVDRYLQKARPEILVPQETLNVVPGFEVTRLPLPEEQTPTAFAWDRRGRLLFATLKGRVWRAEDTDGDGIEDTTTLVADGFAAPFGLGVTDEQGDGQDIEAIDVLDKTALSRLTDTDGNGTMDRTRIVASGWGHSTDYHGWVVGLPKDDEGNYYAVVSNRFGPLNQRRGQVMKLEKLAEPTANHRAYETQSLAIGLRFPMGIARNREGGLFVTDNEGNYNPYNELNHVVLGGHYGFYNYQGLEDTPEIKAMPTSGPAVGIPHPWVQSVNGICFLETPKALMKATGKSAFGPYEGHMIGCESTTQRLIRISLQKVGDRYLGAAYPLTIPPPIGEDSLLRPLVAQVAPDGAILVGSVHDSAWGAGRNLGEIVKLRFSGQLPLGIAEMRAVENGFELLFTGPVDRAKAADRTNYQLVSARRIPTPAYGGPDVDQRTEKIQTLKVSEDGRRVVLTLPEMRVGFVYALRLRNLTTDGQQFYPAEAYFSMGPLP